MTDSVAFRCISARIRSFKKTKIPRARVANLADAGFYYLSYKSAIKCFACKAVVYTWGFDQNDDPWEIHYVLSPECQYLNSGAFEDFEDNDAKCDEELKKYETLENLDKESWKAGPAQRKPKKRDTERHESAKRPVEDIINHIYYNGSRISSSAEITIKYSPDSEDSVSLSDLIGAKYPDFVFKEKRLESFANWPMVNKPNPEVLAAAGFFYNGIDDDTKCYYCGEGLHVWSAMDDPVAEHSKWFSDCAFIKKLIKERK